MGLHPSLGKCLAWSRGYRSRLVCKMKYDLRPYQKKASDIGVYTLQTSDKPFILVLATGAGKSLVIADMCRELNDHVLILQPSKEILEQNYAKLVAFDPMIDAGIYSASVGRREIRQFTYATIGSIKSRPEDFKHFKYVILDECHQLNPKNLGGMLTKFLKDIGCTKVCGLTATPYRLCQKYFYEGSNMFYTSHLKMINRIHPYFFKSIKYQIETGDLIQQGYLSPIVYRQDKEVAQLSIELNKTGSEYDSEAVERFWNDSRLEKMARIIQRIDQYCNRNLVFCSSLRQAKYCQEMLQAFSIASEIVDGKTPMKERAAKIMRFKNGEVKHMINVGVFTTGFDVPGLDCVTLARPTMSLALYYQMVGRGVRLDPERPDKILRVYDLAGVVSKLGRVETIRIVKEEDGWKDKVVSERGDMSEVPLFKYLVKKKVFARN